MLAEMERLYVEEKLSLSAVGKILGLTRQAVHDRLRRAGIERRSYTTPKNTRLERIRKRCDVAELVHKYEIERRSVLELSRAYGISYSSLLKILREQGVTVRPRGSQTKIKYPEVYALEVGESVVLDLSHLKSSYSNIARMGYRMKARLATKRVKNAGLRITRLA